MTRAALRSLRIVAGYALMGCVLLCIALAWVVGAWLHSMSQRRAR